MPKTTEYPIPMLNCNANYELWVMTNEPLWCGMMMMQKVIHGWGKYGKFLCHLIFAVNLKLLYKKKVNKNKNKPENAGSKVRNIWNPKLFDYFLAI